MDVTAAAQDAALSAVEHNTASSSQQARSSSPAASDSWEDGEVAENDDAEASFVFDTIGDMTVDRELALREALAQDSGTHTENGLLLPNHVAVIKAAEAQGSGTHAADEDAVTRTADADEGDMGDYEQLDQDPSTANRYYGAEEKAERRAKEQCTACGELGHDRRHCPHQHCLACGAMDEHPTRACPMSTSCFRCGGMGHQTRSCPQPRRAGGGRNQECERCGSWNHVKALCPTLWRLYAYNHVEDYDRHRAKLFFRAQKRTRLGLRDANPLHDVEPDPEEVSDLEDEFCRHGEPSIPPMKQTAPWDPVARWCYNCSTASNHWGDDCPEPRTNPTRTNGEPTAFSEFVSRWGPFAGELPAAPARAGFSASSSQFTFNVGTDAVMHIAGTASGKKREPRGKDSLKARLGGEPSSPQDDDDDDDNSVGGEDFRWFGRVKAVYKDGGYLTPREARKGMAPLPEHLFREWLQERERDGSIRSYFVKRARIEAAQGETAAPPADGAEKGKGKKKVPKLTKAERRINREIKRLKKKDRKKGAKAKPTTADDGTSPPPPKGKGKAGKQAPEPTDGTSAPEPPPRATHKKGPDSKKPRQPKKNRHAAAAPAPNARAAAVANRGRGRAKPARTDSPPSTNSSKYRGGYFS